MRRIHKTCKKKFNKILWRVECSSGNKTKSEKKIKIEKKMKSNVMENKKKNSRDWWAGHNGPMEKRKDSRDHNIFLLLIFIYLFTNDST